MLFPGQGSQTAEMRAAVAAARPDLLELACELVGDDPFERVDDGTRFQQPAIFCASLVGWELAAAATRPVALAGHSLGELAALVAAGVLAERDGLWLVVERGRLMQEAAESNGGGMVAVRARREEVEPLLARTGVALANENAPRQVVLAGPEAALVAAEAELAAAGIRTVRLPVAGAFHSEAMRSVVGRFRAAAASVAFAEPRIPVVSCLLAAPPPDPRDALVAGLTSPVRWVETLRALHDLGVERFVETGPGEVLTGLVRRTLPDAEAVPAAELEAVGG